MKRMYATRVGLVVLLLVAFATSAFAVSVEERTKLEAEVRAAETAFAKTMADRDSKAFATFVADDAVFFGRTAVTRGKQAVVESWAGLFEGPNPPFSWSSETAVVLDSGTLALSAGPVVGADGKRFGTFNSIWRRDKDGSWKVVFDKGCDYCEDK